MVDKNGGNNQNLPSSSDSPMDSSPDSDGPLLGLADAKRLLREGLSAALATEHNEFSSPYASLVIAATEPDGSPILLLSTLAIHTQNIDKNPHACLLFQQNAQTGSPLEGGRVSIWGKLEKTESPRSKRRFLARHPSATAYAEFSDFSFFTMNVEAAHYVGGFGRIRSFDAEQILTDCSTSQELIDLEHGFLSHMNNDHPQAVNDFATKLRCAPEGDWRLTGIDPEGLDLVAESTACRLSFDTPINTAEKMRTHLEDLANWAKGHRRH